MTLDGMYWREPLWLWLTLLPLLLLLLGHFRQRYRWHRLADPTLLPWVKAVTSSSRQRLARALLTLSWLLLCVALAGPRTPHWIPPALQGGEASVVVIVDFSASMKAQDARTDRIAQGQALLLHWLNDLPQTLRIGLVIYAGHAHALIRPSADHKLVRHYIGQLSALRPPTLGNNLPDALDIATDMLAKAQGERHIVLLSDGDIDEPARTATESVLRETAAATAVHLQVVGIGGTEAVNVPRDPAEPLMIDGRRVVSRRDASWLQKLANLADGAYQGAETADRLTLTELLDLPGPRIDPAASSQVLWDEWFFVPLLAGVVLMLLSLQLGPHSKAPRKQLLSAFVAIMMLGGCQPAPQDLLKQTLAAGDYLSLRTQASALDGYDARFAEGVACYRLADYACALQSFAQAAWNAPDEATRGRAVFNLANTHFRLGDYDQASVLYRDAELHGISNGLTQRNLAFSDSLAKSTRRRLAEMAETERRADWRAAAREMPADFEDRIAEGIMLSRPTEQNRTLRSLSAADLEALVARGITRLRGMDGNGRVTPGRSWLRSPQSGTPEQTAGLFNRLMPMEIGLPALKREPYRIEGQRPW